MEIVAGTVDVDLLSAAQGMIEAVKPANERGEGRSWVYRSIDPAYTQGRCREAYIKVQKGYTCRTLWSLGRKIPTLMREYRALRRLAAIGVCVPEVLEFHADGDNARLVMAGVADALPLDKALEAYPDHAEDILCQCATVIRNMHAHGWNHGALYPDHIFVAPKPDYSITLIDVEKADRSPWHEHDLDRLLRYLHFESPDLARWFTFCYETEVFDTCRTFVTGRSGR